MFVSFSLLLLVTVAAGQHGHGGGGKVPRIDLPKLPSGHRSQPAVELPKVQSQPKVPRLEPSGGHQDNRHHHEFPNVPNRPSQPESVGNAAQVAPAATDTFHPAPQHSFNEGHSRGSERHSNENRKSERTGEDKTNRNSESHHFGGDNSDRNGNQEHKTPDQIPGDKSEAVSHRFSGGDNQRRNSQSANEHERTENHQHPATGGNQNGFEENRHSSGHNSHSHRKLRPEELPGDKDDKDSVRNEYKSFRQTRGHRFMTPAEEEARLERYESHRRRVKEHNRLYESGQKTFRIKMHEYSDEDLQTLIKQRNSFKSGHFNVKRLESAPPVNLSRHRGALHNQRRLKRQSLSLQSLLSLFQSFSSGQVPSFSLPGFSLPGLPSLPVGPVSPGGGAHKAPVYPTGPDSLDWRLHDYVTSVKNQGVCGSCYTFSGAGAIEGQMAACHGDHGSLSEQNILDCAGSYGAGACDGGDPAQIFKYAKDHGIEPDTTYPYVSEKTAVNRGTCKYDKSLVNPNSWVASYDALPDGDEVSLRNALHVGPISVCISASSAEFQAYSDGVFYFPGCSKEVDHAVLLVGYGSDEKAGDYWVVKNSWGPNWGEDGYVRMKRNANNQCGIASYALYPNLKGC